MKRLTIVLTNYLRPENMSRVLESLRNQSEKVDLFCWDNSPNGGFNPAWADWTVKSTRNVGCAPRWWMARQAETEFVAVMDDDLEVAMGFSRHVCDKFTGRCGGVTGVRLERKKTYRECKHLYSGTSSERPRPVDIVKGRFLMMRTESLVGMPCLENNAEDDIAVSAHVGEAFLIPGSWQMARGLPTGSESLCRRKSHYQIREKVRRRHFH